MQQNKNVSNDFYSALTSNNSVKFFVKQDTRRVFSHAFSSKLLKLGQMWLLGIKRL